jgi:hypothetical protein
MAPVLLLCSQWDYVMPSIACSASLRCLFLHAFGSSCCLSSLTCSLSLPRRRELSPMQLEDSVARNGCMRSCVLALLNTLLLVGPAYGASTQATTTSLTVTSRGQRGHDGRIRKRGDADRYGDGQQHSGDRRAGELL